MAFLKAYSSPIKSHLQMVNAVGNTGISPDLMVVQVAYKARHDSTQLGST
jgi:hypothetical protein